MVRKANNLPIAVPSQGIKLEIKGVFKVKNIPSIRVIKESRLDAVIHTKTKREAIMLVKILGVDEERFYDENDFIECWDGHKENTCYRIRNGKVDQMDCVKFYQKINEEIYEFSDLFATGGTVSIHDLPTTEWYNPMRIDLPEFVFDAEQAKELAERLNKELAGCFNAFPNDGISAKNGGKNSMKFTFYVTDWVDINKTNGEKIPMKRTVAYIGSNTDVEADTSCPVAEYDERIGCLIAAAKISAKRSTEAKMIYNIARSTWGTELSWAILFELANDAFNGNFERVYKKFHNDNIRFEKKRLTCNFCGKVFETIEEKTKHENEHIQNKKNKREKYLIRKEAKRRLAEAEREGKIEQTMKELYKK